MNYGNGNDAVREWHTTVISSGEIPLNEGVDDAATGISIRILNFRGIQWTTDAEHSKRILSCLNQNYGFLGIRFVKRIMRMQPEKLAELYALEKCKIQKRLLCGKFNERIATSIAAIMLAGRVLKLLAYQVDLQQCREFLVENVNKTMGDKLMLGERAYNVIQAEIAHNQPQIEIRHRNGRVIIPIVNGKIWAVGYVGHTKNTERSIQSVAIPEDTLKGLLKKHGFHDYSEILKQWEKNKRIKVGNRGELTTPVSFGEMNGIRCVRIITDEERLSEES